MKPACFQSARVSAPCKVCGRRPERTHIAPADHPALYCEHCCPECTLLGQAAITPTNANAEGDK